MTLKKGTKNKIGYIITAIFIAVCSFFAGFAVHYFTLDKEIRSLIRLKEKIQELYYYEVDDEKFYTVLFDAVNRDVLDDYSQYLTAEEYLAMKESAKGIKQGIGVSFITKTADGEDQLLVASVVGNSPAEHSGIKQGEFVIGYGDDNDPAQITPCTNFDTLKAFLDTKDTGDALYLQVQTAQGEKRIIEIVKQSYVENYVYYKTSTASYGFTGEEATVLTAMGQPLSTLPTDTGYIRLTQFNGQAGTQFYYAMQKLKADGKKNLLLDVRGNGGGYLHILQNIASYFCKGATDKNPLVAIADFGEEKEYYRASGNQYANYFSADSRICVIADENSASATECLLGVLIDYQTIGYEDICLIEKDGCARTYGKGIMQTTYPLFGFDGESVKLTTAEIRWPITENCIHGRGIVSTDGTVVVAEETEDKQLLSAIEKLYR